MSSFVFPPTDLSIFNKAYTRYKAYQQSNNMPPQMSEVYRFALKWAKQQIKETIGPTAFGPEGADGWEVIVLRGVTSRKGKPLTSQRRQDEYYFSAATINRIPPNARAHQIAELGVAFSGMVKPRTRQKVAKVCCLTWTPRNAFQ